jgi:hypothetical protein
MSTHPRIGRPVRLLDQIVIDSKDRDTSQSNSTADFVVRMESSNGDIDILQLTQVNIPLTYDTVSAANGNNDFTIAGGPITIPEGYYTISDLINELNSLTAGYTWTFENNHRVKVTAAGAFAFVPGNASILLGFDPSGTYTGATSYEADWPPDLIENFDYLTLHSDVLTRRTVDHFYHSDNRGALMAKIPLVKTSYGEILSWEPESELYYQFEHSRPRYADFYLKNKNGDKVDLNNHTFSLVFDRFRFV